jgi:hypothetical protein
VGRKRDSNRRSHSRKGRCREVGRASAKPVAPLAGTESSNPFPPPVDLSQQVKFSRLQAIWLYPRFTLSYRDVEDLLAERGLYISHETVRRWVLKFGPLIARKLAAPAAAERPMAPRRDGGSDRRRADVSVARR